MNCDVQPGRSECTVGLGLAQKLCFILWLKITVVEIPEIWENLDRGHDSNTAQSGDIGQVNS